MDFLFHVENSSCLDFIGYKSESSEILVSFLPTFKPEPNHAYYYPGSLSVFQQFMFSDSKGKFMVYELRPLGKRDGDLRELRFSVKSLNGFCPEELPIQRIPVFTDVVYTSRVCDDPNTLLDVPTVYGLVPDFYPGAQQLATGEYGISLTFTAAKFRIPGGFLIDFVIDCLTYSIVVDESCGIPDYTYATGECIFDLPRYLTA